MFLCGFNYICSLWLQLYMFVYASTLYVGLCFNSICFSKDTTLYVLYDFNSIRISMTSTLYVSLWLQLYTYLDGFNSICLSMLQLYLFVYGFNSICFSMTSTLYISLWQQQVVWCEPTLDLYHCAGQWDQWINYI